MLKVRTLLAVIVIALVAGLVAPAGAASGDPRTQREQARQQRARLASQLNALQASDTQLAEAVAALDAHISTQSSKVEAARQAVAAAEAELAQAREALAATQARIVELRRILVERAVAAFIDPQAGVGDSFSEIVNSADFSEAARKRALLDNIAGNDRDFIDELNAAEEDYEIERQAAEAATERAQQRTLEAQNRLSELTSARAAQAAKRQALETRKREILAESAAHAREEGRLTTLIAEREAAERARQQAAARRVSAPANSAVSASGMIWPTRGVVTSEYGQRWGRLHAGIDVSAPTGTTIVAALGGTVIQAGSMGGYGNTVVIDHGGGLTTLYAHMSRIGARNGQRVERGQLIGYVGNTGNSTGPHLHFETRVNGSPQNPRRYLP
jgi:murein DD-endopeptidase MepM/ murein hydrolase activator NlpD